MAKYSQDFKCFIESEAIVEQCIVTTLFDRGIYVYTKHTKSSIGILKFR